MAGRAAGERAGRTRLSQVMIDELRRRILSGVLAPGDQLPTEQQLISTFNVSRTVVREAISVLRANGLVDPRQGRGVFVRGGSDDEPLPALTQEPLAVAAVLEILELRMPIETEAAGLAAVRRSPAQEIAMEMALERFNAQMIRGEDTTKPDFDLHIAIVEATNNRFFVEALRQLGQRTIPRSQLISRLGNDTREYLDTVHAEHREIVRAIEAQDPAKAREEMRHHLSSSYRRYRTLLGSGAMNFE